MASEKQAKAIDVSHHLSDYANNFQVSPLKGLQKYMERSDMLPLAGGTSLTRLPSPMYFPFDTIYADIPDADRFSIDAPPPTTSSLSWLWRLFGSDTAHTTRVVVPKAPSPGDDGMNLSAALQYSPATGILKVQKFIRMFTERVYEPAYSDWTTLIHTGNTDGWSRLAKMLCNPGDTIITEKWTYPSAVAAASPIGVNVLSVDMDAEGMRADSLRKVLSEWDPARGKRPHVMYTVPVGQNPSGTTMGLARKAAIYEICVEFDVIIAEDDPYFFLQAGTYLPKASRAASSRGDSADWLHSLVPSYLKVDRQGRVIRLDTFSKTIAPGVRLGWFTCNPRFAERLERFGETSTQSPSGLTQTLVIKLLDTWSFDGYVRWLRGLATQYKLRRDFFCDLLGDAFELRVSTPTRGAWAGCAVHTAYAKRPASARLRLSEKSADTRKPLLSFVPPSSGMFVWVRLHLAGHPAALQNGGDEPAESLEQRFWKLLADGGVLTAPGWVFAADQSVSTPADEGEDVGDGHMRISFSFANEDQQKSAVAILAAKLQEFFQEA
ncbi:PLP-dependent transferase [Auriscalpium vulgare]|uniref:PLP-dependent transferase n=1 Tax=Auriscalpium vulgare TaxID=40419 RepID=A0ACB8RC33_9AGAM|nr:PLP-dependent transferase [Auriscalpium vulgare]